MRSIRTAPVRLQVESMLRLSKLADYRGRRARPARARRAVQTSPGIAAVTGLPEPTVAKVLKALAAGGLVTSQRGARGGYRLARPLGSIQVADVIAAIDGPVHLTACVEGSQASCETEHLCCLPRRVGPGERGRHAGARHHLARRHRTAARPARLAATTLSCRVGPLCPQSLKRSIPSSPSRSPATSGASRPTSRWTSRRRACPRTRSG